VTPPPPRRRWLVPALVILAFVLLGGALGGVGGRLSEVERNDSASHLPSGAEATRVLAEANRFTGLESTTAIVVYTKDSAITEDERKELILATLLLQEQLNERLAGPVSGPIISDDGLAAETIVHLQGSAAPQIRSDVAVLRSFSADHPQFEVHVTGPAAATADLSEVFGEINGVLLGVTALVILLILVVIYRSPILPFVVLGIAGIGLSLANGTAYLLAKADIITISGDARSILDVLVLGAGTDYALLLASRFRDELRQRSDRYDAMRVAWRAVLPAVVASGGTVMVGLLCLLFSDLPATRVLGPVAAIGITFALLSMLLLLPAVLVLVGRAAFWPFRPVHGRVPESRMWLSVSRGVGRRPRLVWLITLAGLGVLCLGLVRLEANGVPRTQSFLAPADSVTGQDRLSAHFADAAATPVVVIARAEQVTEVARLVQQTAGVVTVKPYVDPVEAFNNRLAGKAPPGPKVVDGLVRVDATLNVSGDSAEAEALVRDLRSTLARVPAADARIGGYTASNLDVQDTAQRDRLVIIPIVLLVVFAILALLLRAVVGPLVLVATVIVSFLATLGVSGVVFRDVLHFAGADSTLPLSAFVFLVALGVDYNIFLMTRVREEAQERGHRAGTLAALAVTGGVITSAGVVLAATFAALAVLPLVFLAELAFVVSFGVLLDALVVRTLLVPALTIDLGRTTWWPGPLRRMKP
jgi:RND superfamily putative drug exporter